MIPVLNDEDDYTLSSSRAVAFLIDALKLPLPAHANVLMVAFPAPVDAPENFLRLVPRDTGFLFHSPAGPVLAGGGPAITLSSEGPNRYRILHDAAEELWAKTIVRNHDGIVHTPVLVGGASFVADPPREAPWTFFEGNAFSLVRWTYCREGNSARLVCCVTTQELAQPGMVLQLAKEASAIVARLDTDSPTSLIQRGEIEGSAIHDQSREEWGAYVDAIQATIATGEFEKLVAARRSIVDLPRPADDTVVMARLFAGYPACTHFGIRRPNGTFFGATPETLFRKIGRKVMTEALAGTIRVDDDAWTDSTKQAEQLRASSKDQSEHAVVVRAIRDSLAPLCESITHADVPESRRVRHLLHLRTPITGELREGVTAFDLVSALHPTPAVGGFPTKKAASWINAHEAMERGLYSGVVGWFDANGDAELAVAIRCGVVTPARAYLYAGAGIVKASSAESEYNETAAKMIPLLRAIGAAF